jgi:hypothetical protein
MATTGAAGGFIVASGTFTRDAQTFAESAGIELIDGPALTRMIEEVRRKTWPAGESCAQGADRAQRSSAGVSEMRISDGSTNRETRFERGRVRIPLKMTGCSAGT